MKILLLTILLYAPDALAQIGGNGKFGRVFEESYEDDLSRNEDLEEDDISPENLEKDLFLDAYELRSIHERQMAVFVGQALPWQSYGVFFNAIQDSTSSLGLGAGTGKWDFNTKKEKIDYELQLRSSGITFIYRTFFSRSGFFLQGNVGWLYWQGRITPSGTATDLAPEILKSSFYASGPVLAMNMGYQHQGVSGYFIEYSFLGFSKAFLVNDHFSQSTVHSREITRERIGKIANWGLFNLAVGRAF